MLLKDHLEYLDKYVTSSIIIKSSNLTVWNNVTNIKSEYHPDTLLFKILNIPKSMKAEIIAEGISGIRLVYFNTGKKFVQKINSWNPYNYYSFTLYPEKGFTILHLFEISEGVIQLNGGAYELVETEKGINLKLTIYYKIKRNYRFLTILAKLIVGYVHKNILIGIKKDCEQKDLKSDLTT